MNSKPTFIRDVSFAVDDLVLGEVEGFEEGHCAPDEVPGLIVEEGESADDGPVGVVHQLHLQRGR